MKLSESQSKVRGVQLGEAALNFLNYSGAPIDAKFAIIDDDGNSVGFMTMTGPWEERVVEALRVFAEVLETEAMARLFRGSAQASETSEPDKPSEPDQF